MTSDERLREEQMTSDQRLRGEQTSRGSSSLRVTVRYFGAARAAAGAESQTLMVAHGTSVAELTGRLAERNERLATVLARCSYLCDGVAVRDTAAEVLTGQIIDVLPPFAGG
jgi:molybdopterin converting factor small subunit